MAENIAGTLISARQNASQEISNSIARYAMFGERVRAMKREEAGQRLTALQARGGDLNWWLTATPEDIGGLEAAINAEEQELGLPAGKLQDPRAGEFTRMIRQLQADAMNGIGVDSEGRLTDLALLPFAQAFGERWLTEHTLDTWNEMQSAKAAAPPEEAGPDTSQAATVQGKEAIRMNAGAGPAPAEQAPKVGTWREALRGMTSHATMPPVPLAERRAEMRSNINAYAAYAARTDADPALVRQWEEYILQEAPKRGMQVSPFDLQVAQAAAKAPLPTAVQGLATIGAMGELFGGKIPNPASPAIEGLIGLAGDQMGVDLRQKAPEVLPDSIGQTGRAPDRAHAINRAQLTPIKLANGDVATTHSRTIDNERDGKREWLVIPGTDTSRTITDRVLTDEEARAQFKRTGKYFRAFDDQASADQYARWLRQDEARRLGMPAETGAPLFIDKPPTLAEENDKRRLDLLADEQKFQQGMETRQQSFEEWEAKQNIAQGWEQLSIAQQAETRQRWQAAGKDSSDGSEYVPLTDEQASDASGIGFWTDAIKYAPALYRRLIEDRKNNKDSEYWKTVEAPLIKGGKIQQTRVLTDYGKAYVKRRSIEQTLAHSGKDNKEYQIAVGLFRMAAAGANGSEAGEATREALRSIKDEKEKPVLSEKEVREYADRYLKDYFWPNHADKTKRRFE